VLNKVSAELVQWAAAAHVVVADTNKRKLSAIRQTLEVLGEGVGSGQEGEDQKREEK
jgi:hypothetical protein